ncbi:hypothetical protein K3G39_12675 [Pontibacter sp. HSC-14F20]|uniref:hypothetical protein n=1 Tax=Pontibacter sp. HSC-14F20 TaxID=2864136 RepID=UPI001C733B18|nr:hypothetical protein [Pontibacter sp. HSC-14F20]MBX0334093.1 hypothetical protein [Pontibacter sp. HSC-14F20]
MNLSVHLKGFYRKAGRDGRLRRPHLSLYLALLVQSQGGGAFRVNRSEAMAWARIASRPTYHRCIWELDKWGYLYYLPSHDPASRSRVYIRPLAKEEAASEPTENATAMKLGFAST